MDTAPKPDLVADTAVVDVAPVADVMAAVDTSPKPDATTVPETSPPPVVETVDAGKDAVTAGCGSAHRGGRRRRLRL